MAAHDPVYEACAMCGEHVQVPGDTLDVLAELQGKASRSAAGDRLKDMAPLMLCKAHGAKRGAYTSALRHYATTGQQRDVFVEAVELTGRMLRHHQQIADANGDHNALLLMGPSGKLTGAYLSALSRGRSEGHAWVEHAFHPPPDLAWRDVTSAENLRSTILQDDHYRRAMDEPPPRWQGAASLQRAWRGAHAAVTQEAARNLRGGLSLAASNAVQPLRDAHPIVVEPGQVVALGTSMDDAAAFEYGRQLHLPFPSVWLALTGKADTHAPTLEVGGIETGGTDLPGYTLQPAEYALPGYGALVDKANRLVPGERARVAVTGVLLYNTAAYTDGESALACVPFVPDDSMVAMGPAGVVVFTPGAGVWREAGKPMIRARDIGAEVGVLVGAPGIANGVGWDDEARRLGGFIIPAVTCQQQLADDTVLHQEWVALGTTWMLAKLALEVMAFIDSVNVSVEQAALERRDLKRAAKRGWRIASEVVIRRRLRRAPTRPGAPAGDREYSHQWEVEGHFNHVRRGVHVHCPSCLGVGGHEGHWAGSQMVAEAGPYMEAGRLVDTVFERRPCQACDGTGLDPDKVRPCFRTDERGERTCPHGCRKEWVPAYVAGPAGTPLVKKTRRIAGTGS